MAAVDDEYESEWSNAETEAAMEFVLEGELGDQPEQQQIDKIPALPAPAVDASGGFKPFAIIKGGQRHRLDADSKKGEGIWPKGERHTIVYANEKSGRQIVLFHLRDQPLSSNYPAKFRVADREFCNSEQFYHYCKAITFDKPGMADAIMQTQKPKEQKAVARNGAFDKDLWNQDAVLAMLIGLMRKFEQNDALKADLLATEGAELVHAMPFDSRWGTKKGVPQILAGKPWTGKNMTGRILMAIRAHFLADAAATSTTTNPNPVNQLSIAHQQGQQITGDPESPVHQMATETERRLAELLASKFQPYKY